MVTTEKASVLILRDKRKQKLERARKYQCTG
jgi:hypothetical protein